MSSSPSNKPGRGGKDRHINTDEYFFSEHIERMWQHEQDVERRLSLRGRFIVASTSTIVGLFALTIVAGNPFAIAALIPETRTFVVADEWKPPPEERSSDKLAEPETIEEQWPKPAIERYSIICRLSQSLAFFDNDGIRNVWLSRKIGTDDRTEFQKVRIIPLRDAYTNLFAFGSTVLAIGFLLTIWAVVAYLLHREEEAGTLNAGVEFTDLGQEWSTQQPNIATVRPDFLFKAIAGTHRSPLSALITHLYKSRRIGIRSLAGSWYAWRRFGRLHFSQRSSTSAFLPPESTSELRTRMNSNQSPNPLTLHHALNFFYVACDNSNAIHWTASAFRDLIERYESTRLSSLRKRRLTRLEQGLLALDFRRQPILTQSLVLADFGVTKRPVGFDIHRAALVAHLSARQSKRLRDIHKDLRVWWDWIPTTIFICILLSPTIKRQLTSLSLDINLLISVVIATMFGLCWPWLASFTISLLNNKHRRRRQEASLREAMIQLHEDALKSARVEWRKKRLESPAFLDDVKHAADRAAHQASPQHRPGRTTPKPLACKTIIADPITENRDSTQSKLPMSSLQDFIDEYDDANNVEDSNLKNYREANDYIESWNTEQGRRRSAISDINTQETRPEMESIRKEMLAPPYEDNDKLLLRQLRYYSLSRNASLDVLVRTPGFYLQLAEGFLEDYINREQASKVKLSTTGRLEYFHTDLPKNYKYNLTEGKIIEDNPPLPPVAWRTAISTYYAAQQNRTINWNLWFRIKRCERLFIIGIAMVLIAVAGVASFRGFAALDAPAGRRVHFGDQTGEPTDAEIGSGRPTQISGTVSDLITINNQSVSDLIRLQDQSVEATTTTLNVVEADNSVDVGPTLNHEPHAHVHKGDVVRDQSDDRRTLTDD